MGKSRLLAEFTECAQQDDEWVLVGRCVDFGEGGVPFAPFAQVFTTVADEVDRTRLPELLGQARHELARIAPDITERAPGDIGSDADDRRGRLFGAVADALRALAREHGPLVVALEDVHWARASTLDLLSFLTRNLDDEPLLLVATFRSDELHRRHPLRPVLGELARLPHVHRLQLEALDDEQVAELVAARLDRLPDPVREVVDIAAVAGSGVEHRLLAAVSDHDAVDLTSVLRTAVDRHVLHVDGDTYRFRHELVREVVTDDLLPGRRTELHRGIAMTVEEHPELAPGGRRHADPVLAHHWYAARDLQRALNASLRAAPKALESAAHAEALEHDERALELWDQVGHDEGPQRIEVLERAAGSAYSAGRYQRAIAHLRSALELAGGDVAHEADLRRRLALALVWGIGDQDAALVEGERAHQLVADLPPSPLKAQVVGDHARLHMLVRDERTSSLARDALELARTIGDRAAESHVRNTLGIGLVFDGDVEGGIAHLREALTTAREIGDTRATARAFNNLVVTHRDMAGPDRQDREAIAQSALAWLLDDDNVGAAATGGVLPAAIANDALRRGRWDRTEQLLDWMAARHMEGSNEAYFRNTRARLRWMQGRLEEAVADTGRLHLFTHHNAWFAGWAYTLDAVLAAARGDLEGVRTAVTAGRQVLALGGHSGDPTLVALRLDRALVRAEVDASLHTDQVGAEHLERASEALQGMRRRMEDETPATPGERHRAELYLHLAEAAHDQAVDLGTGLLQQEIESLARRAQVRLPGVEVITADDLGLTSRQTQVLELLACGMTNREIGQELYITEKTASVHVSNILSKLAVDDRYEAAECAIELGLVDGEPPDG